MPGDTTPMADAWHHDVVFQISHEDSEATIHTVSNPSGFKEALIHTQLSSDSFILIKRADVVSRFDGNVDLSELTKIAPSWEKHNVLGQVCLFPINNNVNLILL